MHEKKDYEKERRPERIKQHRASAGFDELAQNGKIPINVRCACWIAAEGALQGSRQHTGAKPIFKPCSEPAQYGAPQSIKHASDHNRERNDQREHQQRVNAVARQDAIIDLKEVDGRSEKQQIVAATVCEHEAKRACAGPQDRLQRGLWRRHEMETNGRHQHCHYRQRFSGSAFSLDRRWQQVDWRRPAALAAGSPAGRAADQMEVSCWISTFPPNAMLPS